ncbi:hypothetical protein [Pediococcus cellicola]|uniref:Uncharacterized protein n=1 Tax=Pediococcus cellicola TaxID=319652 RepID=A0A0R2ITQ5_9LACO|nr:hypothetical protein [Pediococcus cellicola]KRN66245.1 hypothetical protein IV80_GL001495 [Pediococcus cellicola]GEL15186.1 hypothetical protein PCE01_09880 [Pediococcus cellicola]
MLDVWGSLKNVQQTVQAHLAWIKARKSFERVFAVDFEMAYSDFRVVQMALQLAGEMALLKRYTTAYSAIYNYEHAYVQGGLEEFNRQYGEKLADYEQTVVTLEQIIKEIGALLPEDDASNLV